MKNSEERHIHFEALERVFNGRTYKYFTTEPTDDVVKQMRRKGFYVRVTTYDSVREMWIAPK
jgi:hypothetical protein